MRRLLHHISRLAIALVILTVIGQIRIHQRSLESRYHEAVNSQGFQEAYWAVLTPVTYTYGKIVSIFKKPTETPMAR